MIDEIASLAYEELEASRKKPKNSMEQLKSKLAAINAKQAKLMDLYLDGNMDKAMLHERSEDLLQQKNAIENEIETNKAIERSNSINKHYIKKSIESYVANLYDLKNIGDDEFMNAVFVTFVELVEVSKTEIKVHIKADLPAFVGAKMKIGGAKLMLTPIKIEKTIQRKTNIFGKNNQIEL
jgi:hypothetical protein